MCQSLAKGGRRCAAHTRPGFHAAVEAVNTATSRRAQQAAMVRGLDAVAAHAGTPTGQEEVAALRARAERDGDQVLASFLSLGQDRATRPASADTATSTGATDREFLSRADASGRVEVRGYAVVVHPRTEWPIHYLHSNPLRTATIAPDTPVHTTQRHVYADAVVAKGDPEVSGGTVTVALQPVRDRDGNRIGQRIWVVDGHHTLVAARRHGKPVTVSIHGVGHDPISPPRLPRRATVTTPRPEEASHVPVDR